MPNDEIYNSEVTQFKRRNSGDHDVIRNQSQRLSNGSDSSSRKTPAMPNYEEPYELYFGLNSYRKDDIKKLGNDKQDLSKNTSLLEQYCKKVKEKLSSLFVQIQEKVNVNQFHLTRVEKNLDKAKSLLQEKAEEWAKKFPKWKDQNATSSASNASNVYIGNSLGTTGGGGMR